MTGRKREARGLAGFVSDLEKMAGLASALGELEHRTRADVQAGVIDMVEVAPGVFAAPSSAGRRVNPVAPDTARAARVVERHARPVLRAASAVRTLQHELGKLGRR